MKFPKLPELELRWPTPDEWRRLAPPLCVAALVLLNIWIYGGVFGGEVAGDDNTFHFADAARMRECLGQHDFDFWSPAANNGYSLGYYYQLVPSMGPALGSWIFGGSILFWFQLGVFLPFVLAPIATYRGMRLMQASPWEACGAAVAVAVCAGLSKWGFASDGTFSVGLYTQGWAFAAFPLALGHGARWLDEGKSLGPAAFWGLFVGLTHPVAGVALGLALAAGEVGRWIVLGLRALWPVFGGPAHKLERTILFGVVRALAVVLAYAEADRLDNLHVYGTYGWPMLVVAVLAVIEIVIYLFQAEVTAWWATPPAPSDDARRALPAFARLWVLGAFLVIGSAAAWLPVFVDYDSYGGFPHRVAGEEGWHVGDVRDFVTGGVLDAGRLPVLTFLIPVVAAFVRTKWLRRLWSAAIACFIVLVAGRYIFPHILPASRDDNFPPIRVLGALQVCLALAAGGGFVWLVLDARRLLRGWKHELSGREALGWVAGACAFIAIIYGAMFINGRARNAYDYPDFHREELDDIWAVVADQTEGREQVRAGAEAHWSNLLPYVYTGRPAMLQMGGAALQSSPTYVYQWEQTEPLRSAILWDAPLVLLRKQQENEVPDGDEIAETAHYELKRMPASGLVTPVQVVGVLPPGRWPARDEGIQWMAGKDAKYKDLGDGQMKDLVLGFAGFGGPGPAPQGVVLAYSSQPSPGDEPDYTADVEASATTTFMFKISWHKRWHAFMDGAPIAIRRVTPDFVAIDVPKGRHHLALRFDRPLWSWLIWLLWPGLTALGWLWCRRRGDATAPSASPPSSAPAATA